MDGVRTHSTDIESNIKNKELLGVRRAHLAEIATRIFVEKGFASVSVNEIAQEAGMSVGSLYKYVRTKEDILWLVMDYIYTRLEATLSEIRREDGSPQMAMRALLDGYLHGVDELRDGILLMYREWRNLPREARREFMQRERDLLNVFVGTVEQGIKTGEFTASDPVLLGLNIMMTGRTWALKGWILSDVSLEEYIQRQTDAALEMLRAKPAGAKRAVAAASHGNRQRVKKA